MKKISVVLPRAGSFRLTSAALCSSHLWVMGCPRLLRSSGSFKSVQFWSILVAAWLLMPLARTSVMGRLRTLSRFVPSRRVRVCPCTVTPRLEVFSPSSSFRRAPVSKKMRKMSSARSGSPLVDRIQSLLTLRLGQDLVD